VHVCQSRTLHCVSKRACAFCLSSSAGCRPPYPPVSNTRFGYPPPFFLSRRTWIFDDELRRTEAAVTGYETTSEARVPPLPYPFRKEGRKSSRERCFLKASWKHHPKKIFILPFTPIIRVLLLPPAPRVRLGRKTGQPRSRSKAFRKAEIGKPKKLQVYWRVGCRATRNMALILLFVLSCYCFFCADNISLPFRSRHSLFYL
jgi:hypothetical protein